MGRKFQETFPEPSEAIVLLRNAIMFLQCDLDVPQHVYRIARDLESGFLPPWLADVIHDFTIKAEPRHYGLESVCLQHRTVVVRSPVSNYPNL